MGGDLPGIICIDVPESELPASLRARLVPGGAIAGSDRFRPAQPTGLLLPVAWLAVCAVVGITALIAVLRTGFDSDAGDERFVYAGLAGALLLGAVFAGTYVRRAVSERRRQGRGDSRWGIHLIAREGVLIRDQSGCTWAPRDRLTAPVDDPSTDTRFGEGGLIFLLADGAGQLKRWGVPRRVGREIDLWRREGIQPDW